MNILIVGLGSIARKHINALKVVKPDAIIYALRSNPNAEPEEGVENIYSLEDIAFPVDFAIISNPSNLHYQFIEMLAKKDIPLFIEKPAVHSLENTDRLVNLIEEKQLPTYVACNLRFHPCIAFLKDKIGNGVDRINEINIYCGSYLPDWRPGKDFRAIYSSNASMGGGVHLDLFHELDYAAWLFGLPLQSTSVLRNVSGLAIDAIDYANFILEYDTFTTSIILNYYRRKPKREMEIVFDNETWKVDILKAEVKNDNGDYLLKANDFNIGETYVSQLKYFINCLKEKESPMNSFKESLENLKICLNHE